MNSHCSLYQDHHALGNNGDQDAATPIHFVKTLGYNGITTTDPRR